MIFLYFVGTAGSGKTTLTYAFQQWMNLQGYDAITVNLDPGVEKMKYAPDIDIREMISLSGVMEEYNLGPNGAQIVCADLLALKVNEIKEIVDGFNTDYVLIDTPGQIELFAFREASKHIIEAIDINNSAMAFLFDPFLSKTPSGFISQIMLSATTQFRFHLPFINVLSKSDLLDEKEKDRIMNWVRQPEDLLNDAINEEASMEKQLSIELFRVLEQLGVYKMLTPVSSETMTGMEDIYSIVQQVFMGGEDLEK
ncbi:MAG: ATP/GTP-binding protein [Candidatus Thermoplasmatota archaeon]|nr:ATP/GTP-binding protein [Candidatus Thermoplasmatota archaeon]